MSEAVAAAAAAVPPPPPPPPAAAAPAAPAVVATPPPAVATPAAVPAAEPARPAAAAPAVPAPAEKPPVPDAKAAEPAKPAAPVEIEIKLPEGAKYDPAAIADLKAIAKEHGITGKQAEAILALDQKHTQMAQKAFLAKAEQQAKADIEALKTDKEFGGAVYDKTVADARSAASQFFGEDFSKLMEASGLQNHPAVVKGLARIRKAIAEDSTASRAPGSQPPPVGEQKKMSRTERWKQQYLPKK